MLVSSIHDGAGSVPSFYGLIICHPIGGIRDEVVSVQTYGPDNDDLDQPVVRRAISAEALSRAGRLVPLLSSPDDYVEEAEFLAASFVKRVIHRHGPCSS